ncbi:MAG: hypothetical protein AABM64_06765 [Pseudomonadota bacterium]
MQAPRPDPFAPEPAFASADFWRYPVERNAFRRLPVVTGSLNKIFALADGKNIWAVGDAGLIVHSVDGGRHWERQSIGATNAAGETREKGAANGVAPGGRWITEAWAADAPSAPDRGANDKANSQAGQTAPKPAKGETPTAQPGRRAADPSQSRQSKPALPTPPEIAAPPDLSDIVFSDSMRGWAVGGGGTILTTPDGGKTWTAQASGTRAGSTGGIISRN